MTYSGRVLKAPCGASASGMRSDTSHRPQKPSGVRMLLKNIRTPLGFVDDEKVSLRIQSTQPGRGL